MKRLALMLLIFVSVLSARAENPATPRAPEAEPHSTLALRANLLRWATLTPDLGLEWRINRNVSVAVEGAWTSWSWNIKDRRYALREIAPEFRWYLGQRRRGYVGAMYKAGAFNYKFSELGKQGNINGCGLTGGYCLPLGSGFSLDFSLALGWLHARYETYRVVDAVRVREADGHKEWVGPVNAGVTLSWTVF